MAIPYEGGVPRVMPQTDSPGGQSINVSPDSFGASIGRGVEQLGQAAQQTVRFYQDVAVDDQLNKVIAGADRIKFGDPNVPVPGPDGKLVPDSGYMGTNGADAMNRRGGTIKQIDDLIAGARKNLTSAEQQHKFDAATRRMQSDWYNRIGAHADRQFQTWAEGVNDASAGQALNRIARGFDDPEEVKGGMADLMRARVQRAQLKYGGDQSVLKQFEDQARQEGVKAWTEAIAVKDPARAMKELDKNREIMGVQYDEMAAKFRVRKEQQVGQGKGEGALLETYKVKPAGTQIIPVLDQVGSTYGVSGDYLARVVQIESNGNLSAVSPTGAKGPFQFVSGTARQYNLKDPHDLQQSADAAARLTRDNQIALTSSLGRPPTDPELYLAHQQGAAGAAKLLRNPMARAGDLVGDQAIRVNGGDPNAPASAFTGMWTARFSKAPAATLQSRKADAYQIVTSDPDINPNERQIALHYINQTISSQQIAMDATEKQKREASDQAAGEYSTRMGNNDYNNIAHEIANDQRLEWRTKNALIAMAEKNADEGVAAAAKHYGSGYWDAYSRILAPSDDASRISDMTTLYEMARPGGSLTVSGVAKLGQMMQGIRKDINSSSEQRIKLGIMAGIKTRMSNEIQFPGGGKISDPDGEYKFNTEFIPAFEAGYDRWLKDGKDPREYLTAKRAEELADSIRPRTQVEAQRIRAASELLDTKPFTLENMPPPPPSITPKLWNDVMNMRPKTADGKTFFPAGEWARIVNGLLADPTPEKIKLFNESKFGTKAGLDATKLINALTGKRAPAAPVAPAADVGAAP